MKNGAAVVDKNLYFKFKVKHLSYKFIVKKMKNNNINDKNMIIIMLY